MYAVFYMHQSVEIEGLEDCSIHVFATEDDAESFVFDKLVEAGCIVSGAWHGKYEVEDERYESKAEAIEAVQMTFGGLEFFHIYPATDHREAQATTK